MPVHPRFFGTADQAPVDTCAEPQWLALTFTTENVVRVPLPKGNHPFAVGDAVRQVMSLACLDQRHGLIPESVRFEVQ